MSDSAFLNTNSRKKFSRLHRVFHSFTSGFTRELRPFTFFTNFVMFCPTSSHLTFSCFHLSPCTFLFCQNLFSSFVRISLSFLSFACQRLSSLRFHARRLILFYFFLVYLALHYPAFLLSSNCFFSPLKLFALKAQMHFTFESVSFALSLRFLYFNSPRLESFLLTS